ncbi:ComEA family DNA-binding protein [Streptomyces sp. NPDC006529]|uniref:ComEA family DNA-binding protein n=1 Tax=Streptomyces sp. NPDC006529 TaxID=3157177 RepID=UPI00339F26B0
MTLRTRTAPTSRATSGPGRPYSSDGRSRTAGGRFRASDGRTRRQGAAPVSPALRRRADALLNGSGGAREAPPDGGVEGGSGVSSGVDSGGAGGAGGPEGVGPVGPRADRVGWALGVRERMPVWVQTRCGLEPKTLGAVAVVLVAAVGFAGQQYWSAGPKPVTAPAVDAPPLTPAGAASTPFPAFASPGGVVVGPVPAAPSSGPRIVVDVSGKVRDPGIRRLPAGSRVEDALAAAGGARPGTDLSGLNRARILVDGEQVLVGVPAPPAPVGGAPGGGGGGGSAGAGTAPVSLATATVEQLDGLPGVGPVLARHIVDYRTARGGFRSVEELRQVNGIGERRFADLRPLVRP